MNLMRDFRYFFWDIVIHIFHCLTFPSLFNFSMFRFNLDCFYQTFIFQMYKNLIEKMLTLYDLHKIRSFHKLYILLMIVLSVNTNY